MTTNLSSNKHGSFFIYFQNLFSPNFLKILINVARGQKVFLYFIASIQDKNGPNVLLVYFNMLAHIDLIILSIILFFHKHF